MFGIKDSFLGGYNGGGNIIGDKNTYNTTGGGATDISLYGINKSADWNNTNHLYSRIIVAGGGGGSNCYQGSSNGIGGAGGGISGGTGSGTITGSERGQGGTQSSGGGISIFSGQTKATAGTFGCGGTGNSSGVNNANYHGSRSDGGGWYGGGGGGANIGGGGSGYVYTSSTVSYYPSGCKLNSSYYLTNAKTIAGNTPFSNVAGTGNETGHSGNGAAKITPVN